MASLQQGLNQLNPPVSQTRPSLHGSAHCGIDVNDARLDEEAEHQLRVANFTDQEVVVLLNLGRHELLQAVLRCLFLREFALEAGQLRHV